ncbi:MAG: peptidylprolyl isomerase [Sterolibacterium sp.]|nr:peptidylprolyl isomerase [Sterolibacterium sp.]
MWHAAAENAVLGLDTGRRDDSRISMVGTRQRPQDQGKHGIGEQDRPSGMVTDDMLPYLPTNLNFVFPRTLFAMKHIFTLLCFAMLTACAGNGDTTPTVTDIQGKNLNYGVRAEFDFLGTYLDTVGISANVPNCTGQTPVFISPVHQVLTCTITAIGDLNVQVRDGAGAVIFSKIFTIPAPRVIFATTLGNITVDINPHEAPLTVSNFLNYVQTGFYSNTLFHRVIAGFVAQGGAFTTGLTVKPGTLAPIPIESNNGLTNLRGTIAMARTSEPNSATSQFYFNLVDNPALDYKDPSNPGYAVFGKIVQGLDVMDAIGAVPTNTLNGVPDIPVTDVVVRTVLRIK